MTQEPLFSDGLLFVPAGTTEEAAARLFALTGASDPGTRGPKRSLEALAASVGVDVDLAATNAVLAEQVAASLQAEWRPGRDTQGSQVTLDGLNTLLRAATGRLWETSRRTSVPAGSYTEVLRVFPAFTPAGNKQDAVNRLSDLAGVFRDTLGPGGKEHRVTLEALARRVAPGLLQDPAATRSKHSLLAALCEALGVPLLHTAGSTGQTITLEGLNLLLAGAERRLQVTSSGWATAQEEGSALVRVLRAGLSEHWDGRATVEGMRASGSRHWRHLEWAGFHFEDQVSALLNIAYPTPPVGGPRRTYGSTVFDYASATRLWDAKAHTVLKVLLPSGTRRSTASKAAVLNDVTAVTSCLAQQGLGFLVLDGGASYDETGEFDAWHRAYTRQGRPPPTFTSNTGLSRGRKSAFTPTALRALWISDLSALQAGVAGGWISQKKQGAQPVQAGQTHGASRNDKFHLKVHRAAPWVVAQDTWPTSV